MFFSSFSLYFKVGYFIRDKATEKGPYKVDTMVGIGQNIAPEVNMLSFHRVSSCLIGVDFIPAVFWDPQGIGLPRIEEAIRG